MRTPRTTIVVEGGAQASYQLMLAEADIFNQAPGCDLVGLSGAEQPLDYGCPGLNGEAGLDPDPARRRCRSRASTVTSGSKKFILSGAVGRQRPGSGDQVTDSDGVIPVADPIKTLNPGDGKIKLAFAANGNRRGE